MVDHMAPGAVAVSYFLAQIVPVIPFALTTRVGVAEEDGTLKHHHIPSTLILNHYPQSNTGSLFYLPSTAPLFSVLPVFILSPSTDSGLNHGSVYVYSEPLLPIMAKTLSLETKFGSS